MINASVLCFIGILDKTGIISFSSEKPFLGFGKFQTHDIILLVFLIKIIGVHLQYYQSFTELRILLAILKVEIKTWSSLFIVLLLAIIFSSLFLVDSRSSILIIFFFASVLFFLSLSTDHIFFFTITFLVYF